MRTLCIFLALFSLLQLCSSSQAVCKVIFENDDTEELPDIGRTFPDSSDLELMYDESALKYGSDGYQVIGIRFHDVRIPRGSIVESAYIQFTPEEFDDEDTPDEPANVYFYGHLTPSAYSFTFRYWDVSLRPVTVSSVDWIDIPAAVELNVATADSRSPDMASIVQEIVSQPQWLSGNAFAAVLSGQGQRLMWAYQSSDPAFAPFLVVNYSAPGNDEFPMAPLCVDGLSCGSGDGATGGGGTCVAGVCTCPTGFYGAYCEVGVSEFAGVVEVGMAGDAGTGSCIATTGDGVVIAETQEGSLETCDIRSALNLATGLAILSTYEEILVVLRADLVSVHELLNGTLLVDGSETPIRVVGSPPVNTTALEVQVGDPLGLIRLATSSTPGLSVIDGMGTHRAIQVTGQVVLEHVMIKNGLAGSGDVLSSGGSVLVEPQASFAAQHCIFWANSASDTGGAIYASSDSTVSLDHCLFAYNNAVLGGSALVLDSTASGNVTGCDFVGNSVVSSVYTHGALDVRDSHVRDAHCEDAPVVNIGRLRITDSKITECTGHSAGAVHNLGDVEFDSCEISYNSASIGGGVANYGNAKFSRSLVALNSALSGGGIWNQGQLVLDTTAVVGNHAQHQPLYTAGDTEDELLYKGGGLACLSVCEVTSSTFGENTATDGGDHILLRSSTTVVASNWTYTDNGFDGWEYFVTCASEPCPAGTTCTDITTNTTVGYVCECLSGHVGDPYEECHLPSALRFGLQTTSVNTTLVKPATYTETFVIFSSGGKWGEEIMWSVSNADSLPGWIFVGQNSTTGHFEAGKGESILELTIDSNTLLEGSYMSSVSVSSTASLESDFVINTFLNVLTEADASRSLVSLSPTLGTAGDSVSVVITALDVNGFPVTHGGDSFSIRVVRLLDDGTTFTPDDPIGSVDLGDGTYVVTISSFPFPGNFQLHVYLYNQEINATAHDQFKFSMECPAGEVATDSFECTARATDGGSDDSGESKSSSNTPRVIVSCLLGGASLVCAVAVALWLRKRNAVAPVDWKVAPEDVELQQFLGEGGFGEVHLGLWRGSRVAVKLLKKELVSALAMRDFERELSIISELRHPNIVLFMGACLSPTFTCLITELMSNGSVDDILHSQSVPLSWSRKVGMVVDACRGMVYLHSSQPPIIHRDLKVANLLVDSDWRVKVSDFGLTMGRGQALDAAEGKGGVVASVPYAAPEILTNSPATTKSDVYSFAIVMFEILTRSEPYPNLTSEQIQAGVLLRELRPKFDDDAAPGFSELIRSCWAQKPADRPSFDHILEALEEIDDNRKQIRTMANQHKSAPESSVKPDSQWEIESQELVYKEVIGRGMFGTVHLGDWNGSIVAIKRLTQVQIREHRLQAFREEAALMASLRHPNICLFMGACTSPPHIALVTEYCPRGGLNVFLEENVSRPLEFRLVMSLATDIFRGVSYLHTRNPPIIHRDLKSENVLLTDGLQAKIADFGLSRTACPTSMTAQLGSPHWMAPEVITGEDYGTSADIYSCGVIMWELLYRKIPYENLARHEILMDVARISLRPELTKRVIQTTPLWYIDLMQKCWEQDAKNRPTAASALTVLQNGRAEAEAGDSNSPSHVGRISGMFNRAVQDRPSISRIRSSGSNSNSGSGEGGTPESDPFPKASSPSESRGKLVKSPGSAPSLSPRSHPVLPPLDTSPSPPHLHPPRSLSPGNTFMRDAASLRSNSGGKLLSPPSRVLGDGVGDRDGAGNADVPLRPNRLQRLEKLDIPLKSPTKKKKRKSGKDEPTSPHAVPKSPLG